MVRLFFLCPASNYLLSILLNIIIWSATSFMLLAQTPDVYQQEQAHNPTNNLLLNKPIKHLEVDTLGNVWVGTTQGLFVINGLNNNISQIYSNNLPVNQEISYILVESPNYIWVALADNSIIKIDAYSHQTIYHSPPISLTSQSIISLFVRDKTLWIGMSQGLLISCKIFEQQLAVPSTQQTPIHNNIFSVFVDKQGQIFLLSNAGLHHQSAQDNKKQNNKWSNLAMFNRSPHGFVNYFFERQISKQMPINISQGYQMKHHEKSLWILAKLKNKKFAIGKWTTKGKRSSWKTHELPTGITRPRDFTFDKDGNIWICDESGKISQYDIRKNKWKTIKDLGETNANAIAINNKQLYVGTSRSGLHTNPVTHAKKDNKMASFYLPNHLTLLLDVSYSMKKETAKLPLFQKSFVYLLDKMREKDTISVISFSGKANVVLESVSATQKDEILSKVAQIQSGGSTSLYTGLKEAIHIARNNFIKNGNNKIVIITDGLQGNLFELDKLIRAARFKQIVFAVFYYHAEPNSNVFKKFEQLVGKGNVKHITEYNAKEVFLQEAQKK